MSVRPSFSPSVFMEQSNSHHANFRKILYFGFIPESVGYIDGG